MEPLPNEIMDFIAKTHVFFKPNAVVGLDRKRLRQHLIRTSGKFLEKYTFKSVEAYLETFDKGGK